MTKVTGKRVWMGRVLSGLALVPFAASAVLKLMGGPELEQGFAYLGLPISMRFPLAILELTCVVVYLIPSTSVLGAVLLTGYIGGAICTHWRVGDPVYVHIVLGVLVWLGLYLREGRLAGLLPVRKS
jgi:hypothetical protein